MRSAPSKAGEGLDQTSIRMLRRSIIALGLSVVALTAPLAFGQEAAVAPAAGPIEGLRARTVPEGPPLPIDFNDPDASLTHTVGGVSVTARASEPRFASEADTSHADANAVELQLSAGLERSGSPVDLAIARRASVGGDGSHRSDGSEVRVGRGLSPSDPRHDANPTVYAFVSSDNQALTWRPGERREFGDEGGGGLALQDQVQVGDHAAGVAYEHHGVQASVAYVERRQSTRVGQQSFSQDQSFAGVTVTVRH